MKWSLLAPAVLACLVSSSAGAHAEREKHDDRVAVALHAPDSCPSRDELVRAVKERSRSLVVDENSTDGAGAAMDVSIAPGERDFVGIIRLSRGAMVETRELTAETCPELVDAASLLLVLFLDSKDAAPAPSTTSSALPEENRRATPQAPGRTWRPFIGADVQSEAATLPALALGFGIFGGIERDGALLSPALRLEASMVSSDLAAGPSRDGSILRGVVRAEGCPTRWRVVSRISIAPCAWIGAGFLRAEGKAIATPHAATQAWVDVGAGVRARSELKSFFFELGLGVTAPLTRPVVVFENPIIILHRTPAAGAVFSLGGGYRFP